jgi:hypothetical protein
MRLAFDSFRPVNGRNREDRKEMRTKITYAALALQMLLVAGERQQAGQSDVVVRGNLKVFTPLPEVVPGASGTPSKGRGVTR